LGGTGVFELRALHLQSRCSIAWATHPVHFVLVILEMGSCELFGWTDLKPQFSGISASQVARTTVVSHQCPAHNLIIKSSPSKLIQASPLVPQMRAMIRFPHCTQGWDYRSSIRKATQRKAPEAQWVPWSAWLGSKGMFVFKVF
jgi:hypothetical protein